MDILRAARAAFGSVGFSRATIRLIASDAGVDPALVHHYFGTKADLYAATIELPASPSQLAGAITSVDRSQLGEAIAHAFFGIWDDEHARAPLLAMLRGAITGHDAGLVAFREFLTDTLLGVLVPLVTFDDARLRVTLAASQLIGVAVIRYIVGLEPLASASKDEIIAMVAPRLQTYITG